MRRGRAAAAAALAAAVALAAVPALAEEPGRLTVIGRASADVVPDTAAVSVAVERRAPSAGAALDQNSQAAGRVVALAKDLGAEVSTSAVTLQPVMRPVREATGAFREVPDGYEATNAVEIRLSDPGRLGDLLRRLTEGGADRIGGVTFGLRDASAAEDEVRAGAMRDAIRQAETLARAGAFRLGRIERVLAPPRDAGAAPVARMRAAGAAKQAVPVAAGTVAVNAAVEVTWSIAP
ncbi:SIMPL domain-containing protein [Methylobacterium sp. JK268]